MMNSTYRFAYLIVIFAFLIVSCSPQATQLPTVVDVEQAVSILPTVTRKPNATAVVLSEIPTKVPTFINSTIGSAQISSIQFPEWVKNTDTQIFLTPVGTREEGYKNLALFNAETSERFDIPFTSEIGDYFWMPDGSGFGFLHNGKRQITLFSIKEGIVTTTPTPEASLRFLSQSDDRAEPIYVSASNITDSNFFLVASWNPLSPDRKHFIYQEKYDETYTSVFDISSNELIYISDPNDDYFDLFSEWSPDSRFLAIVEVNEVPLNYYTFEILPTFRLRIYNVDTQQIVVSNKNVTFPKWSPDGTKFLFQEWKKWENLYWYAESPPCIFDSISGTTTCYSEVLTDPKITFSSVLWSPNQSMIGYVSFQGFCTITLSDTDIRCVLGNLNPENQNVLQYTWSPDSNFISFEYDTVGPYSDDTDNPKIAIANVQTGEYFSIGENISFHYLGLWRSLANP